MPYIALFKKVNFSKRSRPGPVLSLTFIVCATKLSKCAILTLVHLFANFLFHKSAFYYLKGPYF